MPVFRAANALDRLAEVLDETVAAHEAAGAEDARLAYDAKIWGWTLVQVRAGFDSRDIGHMTPAWREEAVKQLHEQCLADDARARTWPAAGRPADHALAPRAVGVPGRFPLARITNRSRDAAKDGRGQGVAAAAVEMESGSRRPLVRPGSACPSASSTSGNGVGVTEAVGPSAG